MWHPALKPSEVKRAGSSRATKKLRICWKLQTPDWSGGFIPRDKSIPPDSLIAQAHVTGQAQTGPETIHLGWGTIACQVEAIPMRMGDRSYVLSLLHG